MTRVTHLYNSALIENACQRRMAVQPRQVSRHAAFKIGQAINNTVLQQRPHDVKVAILCYCEPSWHCTQDKRISTQPAECYEHP